MEKTDVLSVNPRVSSFSSLLFLTTVVIACVYPRLIFLSIGGLFSLSPYTALSFLTFIYSILLFFSNGNIRKRWFQCYRKNSNVLVLFFVFFAWCGFADLLGTDPGPMLAQTAKFFIFGGSYAITGSIFFLDERIRRKTLVVIIVCAMVDCMFGAFEYTQGRTLYQIFHISLDANGDDPSLLAMMMGISRDGVYRCQSIFNDAILYGQFMAVVVPFAWYFSGQTKSYLIKLICYMLVAVAPLAIYSSGTRSALGVVGISVMTYIALTWVVKSGRINTQRMTITILGVLFATIFMFFLSHEILAMLKGKSADTIGSSDARVQMLNQGMRAVAQSPIYGFGEGSSGLKAGLSSTSGLRSIDNYYLTISIDAGLVGLALLAGVFASAIRTGIRAGLVDRSALAVTAMVLGLAIGQSVISVRDNLTFVFMAIGYVFAVLPTPPVVPAQTGAQIPSWRRRRQKTLVTAA